MGYDIGALVSEALETGFTSACELNIRSLAFMPEVRDMCDANTCSQYGKNWRCPPACGSIEEAAERAGQYTCGVLVQTTGYLEDNFDFETIGETYAKHEASFAVLIEGLRARYPDMLPLGAAACKICEKCTYPDSPCRFPDRAISPIESYGLLVGRLCEMSNMPYYHGKLTITYTGCYLLK